MSDSKTPPRDFYIQITRDCIHDCIFCSVPKIKEYLPLEEIKRRLKKYRELGYTDINITGGEPTLHPNLIDVIKYGVELGFKVRMTTNGVLLEDFDYVKRIKEAGIDRILFSVHHYDPLKEMYINGVDEPDLHKTLKGIENADKLGIEININVTVIRQNYNVLPEIVKMLVPKYKNIRHFNFNFVDITGNVFVGNHKLTPKDIAPRYSETEKYLIQAFRYLVKHGVSFRFERAPLCYASGFEDYNSEANRAAGAEYHVTSFTLDEPDFHFNETTFVKSPLCKECYLKDICFGIEAPYYKIYGASELYPVFLDPNEIAFKIKRQNNFKEPIFYLKIKNDKNEIKKSMINLINSDGGILSFLRNDRKILIIPTIYENTFVIFLPVEVIENFLEILKESGYNIRNIYVLYPSRKDEVYSMLKTKYNFKTLFINESETIKKYVYTPKVIRSFKVPKIIDEISYGVFLGYYNANTYSAFDYFLKLISNSLRDKIIKLNDEQFYDAVLDIYSYFKPKLKMIISYYKINDNYYLSLSRDLSVHDYLYEKLKKGHVVNYLDFSGRRMLSPENIDWVDFREINNRNNVEISKTTKKKVVAFAKNENCELCKICVDNCPERAIYVKDNKIVVDPEKCTYCKVCFDVCPNNQFIPKGYSKK